MSGVDWIGRALARWVALVLRLRWLMVVGGLAAGVACGYYAAGNLGINTDTADMISAELPWRQDFIDYRDSFPARNRNLIVLVEGASAARVDAAANELAAALEQEPAHFESVFLTGGGEFFERNGLLYASLDEVETLASRLTLAQPLLGTLEDRFNGAEVVATAARAVDEASSDAGAEEAQALYDALAAALASAARGEPEPVDWMSVLVEADTGGASRRLLLLQPVLDFTRIQPAAPAIARVRELADSVLGMPGDVSVRLTGTIAMEHEELVSVTQGASRAGLAALLLVAAVLYWAFRSVVLVTVAVVSLIAGLTGTAAFAAWAVGHLNLLSVAFAVLYVGLGVDFILHLGLRFKELVAEGEGIDSAIVGAVRGVGASLVVCAVTTAVGFYAFIPTPFEGVSELGLISGTGMFVSLLVSLTLLPAMLAVFTPKSLTRPRPHRESRLGLALLKHPAGILVSALLLLLATLAALPMVSFDGNPIHLRDPDSESVQAINDLAAASEAPLLDLVALADDRETARRWVEALEALPVVREAVMIESLVPEDQEEKLFVLEDLSLVLGPGFAELERAPFDAAELERRLEELDKALAGGAGPSDAERSLSRALDALLERLRAGPADASERLLRELDAALTADLPGELERLASLLSAEPFDREALPAPLRERWLDGTGRELVAITPLENVNENEAAERFVDAVHAIVPTATGLPVVHHEASATVVRSFQLAFSYALLMVTLLLFFFLRRLSDTVLVIVPILFAAGATAGMTVWLGIPFNFANIIALPLLVGVGVDNGIHMVHRMRTEPPASGEPLTTSTSRAVLASGLTTIASFGNLAFAAHVGMASMGKLLTLGMIMTLLATLLVLPAMLKLRGAR